MSAAPKLTLDAPARSVSVDFDTSLFPLVVTTFGEIPMKDDDVRGYIRSLDDLLEQRGRCVQLIDTTHQKVSASAVQRKIFSDWISEPRARRLAALRMADALVITNALVRGAVTAVFWILPPISPTKIFATPREAIPFLEEHAKAAGLPFTQAMRDRILSGSR